VRRCTRTVAVLERLGQQQHLPIQQQEHAVV